MTMLTAKATIPMSPTPRPHLLRHLRVYCVAARALSFKDAAMLLHLTPSAVSHQIRTLEEQLGQRLFERKTRSLELTPQGRRLLDEVEPLFEAVDAALSRISVHRTRSALRVTLPPFFASELFVPRLASFYERAPGIDIHLDTTDPRPDEHPATADVSILLAQQPPAADLDVHELFALTLTAACSPRIAGRVRELGALVFRDVALIVHRSRPHAWTQWAEEAGLDAGHVKQIMELDSMYAVVRAAERGLGIALVPTVLGSAWFESGALVRVSDLELPTLDRYFFVHRRTDSARAEVALLRRWAITEFARRPQVTTHEARSADAR